MARAAEPHDGSVYIIVGKHSKLVTPDREFDLGEVQTDEIIVKEMVGQRVVGVRVMKAAEAYMLLNPNKYAIVMDLPA